MAVVSPPAWLQAGSYTAHTDRLVTASIIEREGIVQDGDLAVSASLTPGMSVQVAPGKAWIRDAVAGGEDSQGMYNFVNDGPVTGLSVTSSHATLNRIDRVVARVQDADVSGAVNSAEIAVIAGTAASSPVAPALPASSLSLGTISVPANTTAITNALITNSAQVAKVYSSMVENPLVVTSSTRPTGGDRVTGMMIFETDTKRSWQWTGSEWQFRGGKGPRAFVIRDGQWSMSQTRQYLWSLETSSGSFETAYFTFVDGGTGTTGDRIRVKQAGLYELEVYSNMGNWHNNFYVFMRVKVVTGSTGLPAGALHFPQVSGMYPEGRANEHGSRTVFLPEGAEIVCEYEAGSANTLVDEFWMSATLIG